MIEQKHQKMRIGNGEYPVIGAIKTEEYGIVPIVDMPLMSDDEWQRMCLQAKLDTSGKRIEEVNA